MAASPVHLPLPCRPASAACVGGGDLFLACPSRTDWAWAGGLAVEAGRASSTTEAASSSSSAAAAALAPLQQCLWDATAWWDTRGGGTSADGGVQMGDDDDKVVVGGGAVGEAVDALSALVRRGCHVSNNLFYRLLQRCFNNEGKDEEQQQQVLLLLGRRVHALAARSGHRGDAFLATHLIGLYASHGQVEEAVRAFGEVAAPDAHNCAAVMLACARHGQPGRALALYNRAAVEPDGRVLVAALRACAGARDLAAGAALHAHIRGRRRRTDGDELDDDVYVQTSLVDMYAKCGDLDAARAVFERIPRKTVVTWTAMIAGYARHQDNGGGGAQALRLYDRMVAAAQSQQHEDGEEEGQPPPPPPTPPPNCVTYVCLARACAAAGALPLGKRLHAHVTAAAPDLVRTHPALGPALVHMYAKCGSLTDAQAAFDALGARAKASSPAAWTALMAGYARQGDAGAVFRLLRAMRRAGVPPDAVTHLAVLTACSHAGRLRAGRAWFRRMMAPGSLTPPAAEHYACLADMLARAGRVREALQVASAATAESNSNPAAWRSVLGACAKWGDVPAARQAFRRAVTSSAAEACVAMANVYGEAGMWDAAGRVRAGAGAAGRKQPAQSWWTDAAGVAHAFQAGGAAGDVVVEQVQQGEGGSGGNPNESWEKKPRRVRNLKTKKEAEKKKKLLLLLQALQQQQQQQQQAVE